MQRRPDRIFVFIRRPSDIGTLTRAARQARKLCQQDLADRLGVSRWWINAFERGKPTARLDLVLRMLNELEITLQANDAAPKVAPETASAPSTMDSGIDIDAIADTGLLPPPAHRSPKARARR